MNSRREPFDKPKNGCYREREGDFSISVFPPQAGIQGQRLLKALNLVLSEKDIIDHLKAIRSGPTHREDNQDEEAADSKAA